MRTLVHLSDIHFGRTEDIVVDQLISTVRHIKPDVVAISGDLTQRARPGEFERARAFLASLPVPQIIVPGNHDVPLHNIYARFRRAFDAYQHYISYNLEPFYRDDELAILGINTARSLTIKGGRINVNQMDRIEQQLCGLGDEVTKVLVTHHPFDLPQHYGRNSLVRRASKAMSRFARCGIDLLLAGHFHVSHCGPTAVRYEADGHSAVFVQAGTACSSRSRGEPNSFNVIQLDGTHIDVQTFSGTSSQSFHLVATKQFYRAAGGWKSGAKSEMFDS